MRLGSFLCVLALVVAVTGHAHARPHHHHAPPAAPSFWSGWGGSGLVATARAEVGNGAIYGRRNLWCARFVNYVLGRTGHRGTGSDLAWSFSRLPATSLKVGAIAVMRHHVGIVSGVTALGDPILISGNNAGRVREGPVPRSRVAAFVEAE